MRANHALEFIKLLSIVKPKSPNTILGVLKAIVNNPGNGLLSQITAAQDTLARGGVVDLGTVRRVLGRKLTESDIDTIMARGARDAWK